MRFLSCCTNVVVPIAAHASSAEMKFTSVFATLALVMPIKLVFLKIISNSSAFR
jgi:hypothetical protein